MLFMKIEDMGVSISFVEAKDAGREVRFAIGHPPDSVRLSEIVASSAALGTHLYDIHTLTSDRAERALASLSTYSEIPRLICEQARQDATTCSEVLSTYFIKIERVGLKLEPKDDSIAR
jgi:hypothetical protein